MGYPRNKTGPRGAVVLAGVHQELARGWPSGLTLLTGEDAYHLDAAQRALLASLVPEEASDFGLTVFGEQAVDVGKVVATARSAGMFAPRRVVLVRELAALEGDPQVVIDYAKRPPAGSFLLVRAPKLDLRRKLHQTLKKNARLLDFPPAGPADMSGVGSDVRAIAAGKGLELDRQAAAFLAEVCAADFYRIDGELEKIRCWVGGREASGVDLALVQETVAASGLMSGWEVANAVLQRDRPAALAALRELLDSGSEPLMLVGGLAYRARAMLKAKSLLGSGSRPDRAFREAGLWGGGNPARMAEGLGRYTETELLGFPSLLLEADRTLKSRSVSQRSVLEALVDRLTGPVSVPVSRTMG